MMKPENFFLVPGFFCNYMFVFGGLVSIDIGVEARSKRTLKVLIIFLIASKTLLIMLVMTETKVHLQ